MEKNSFLALLYRYFFFGWLFRDVSRGNPYERLVAWRHNQAQAHWLLTYLKRWVALGTTFFVGGCFSSLVLELPWICCVFFVTFSMAVPVISVIVVAWLGLRLLPDVP